MLETALFPLCCISVGRVRFTLRLFLYSFLMWLAPLLSLSIDSFPRWFIHNFSNFKWSILSPWSPNQKAANKRTTSAWCQTTDGIKIITCKYTINEASVWGVWKSMSVCVCCFEKSGNKHDQNRMFCDWLARRQRKWNHKSHPQPRILSAKIFVQIVHQTTEGTIWPLDLIKA